MYGEQNTTSLAPLLLPSAGVISLNAIVGGTVVGIVAILLLILVVFCSCMIYRKRSGDKPDEKPESEQVSIVPMTATMSYKL